MTGRNAQAHLGPVPATMLTDDLKTRVEVVAEIAAAEADAVDADGRFPAAAIAAMRQKRLLSLLVPRDLGGEGVSIGEVAEYGYRLGQACSATAMIFAMHHSAVSCLTRHAMSSVWHKNLLRQIADAQLLVASSTTEGQNGGNVRTSEAPIEREGETIALSRAATVISYGVEADVIATTARRTAETATSDQVLAIFRKSDFVLEPLSDWDALGMRGTASAGFRLIARGTSEQIVPDAYERIHAQTMQPISHLLWASVWAGIAADAVARTQTFIRKAARQSGGLLPPGAPHFTKARATLQMLRSLIANGLARFEAAADDLQALATLDFQSTMALTKVEASELAVAIVLSAMRAGGLAAYRNGGEFSLGRHLRDVLSAPIMINNDRILANVGSTTLMSASPTSLRS
jgi:acyl-CoA dehydrogenase